jgi:hypothetical protein
MQIAHNVQSKPLIYHSQGPSYIFHNTKYELYGESRTVRKPIISLIHHNYKINTHPNNLSISFVIEPIKRIIRSNLNTYTHNIKKQVLQNINNT